MKLSFLLTMYKVRVFTIREHELGQKSILKGKTFMGNNFNVVPFFVKELNTARLPQLQKQKQKNKKKTDWRLNRVQGQKKRTNEWLQDYTGLCGSDIEAHERRLIFLKMGFY